MLIFGGVKLSRTESNLQQFHPLKITCYMIIFVTILINNNWWQEHVHVHVYVVHTCMYIYVHVLYMYMYMYTCTHVHVHPGQGCGGDRLDTLAHSLLFCSETMLLVHLLELGPALVLHLHFVALKVVATFLV